MYIEYSKVNFSGTTNISKNAGNGGGMYIEQSKVNFSGTTIISKNTGEVGGGLRIGSGSSVLFTGYTLFDSNRGSRGGAIYSYYDSEIETGLNDITISFSQSVEFTHNMADRDGGAIFSAQTNITFNKWSMVTFSYNSAKFGGAIYLLQCSVTHTAFDGNRGFNGSVIDSGHGNDFTLSHSVIIFTHNIADRDGGAIFARKTNITFRSMVIFSYNSAENGSGGAINVLGQRSILDISWRNSPKHFSQPCHQIWRWYIP